MERSAPIARSVEVQPQEAQWWRAGINQFTQNVGFPAQVNNPVRSAPQAVASTGVVQIQSLLQGLSQWMPGTGQQQAEGTNQQVRGICSKRHRVLTWQVKVTLQRQTEQPSDAIERVRRPPFRWLHRHAHKVPDNATKENPNGAQESVRSIGGEQLRSMLSTVNSIQDLQGLMEKLQQLQLQGGRSGAQVAVPAAPKGFGAGTTDPSTQQDVTMGDATSDRPAATGFDTPQKSIQLATWSSTPSNSNTANSSKSPISVEVTASLEEWKAAQDEQEEAARRAQQASFIRRSAETGRKGKPRLWLPAEAYQGVHGDQVAVGDRSTQYGQLRFDWLAAHEQEFQESELSSALDENPQAHSQCRLIVVAVLPQEAEGMAAGNCVTLTLRARQQDRRKLLERLGRIDWTTMKDEHWALLDQGLEHFAQAQGVGQAKHWTMTLGTDGTQGLHSTDLEGVIQSEVEKRVQQVLARVAPSLASHSGLGRGTTQTQQVQIAAPAAQQQPNQVAEQGERCTTYAEPQTSKLQPPAIPSATTGGLSVPDMQHTQQLTGLCGDEQVGGQPGTQTAAQAKEVAHHAHLAQLQAQQEMQLARQARLTAEHQASELRRQTQLQAEAVSMQAQQTHQHNQMVLAAQQAQQHSQMVLEARHQAQAQAHAAQSKATEEAMMAARAATHAQQEAERQLQDLVAQWREKTQAAHMADLALKQQMGDQQALAIGLRQTSAALEQKAAQTAAQAETTMVTGATADNTTPAKTDMQEVAQHGTSKATAAGDRPEKKFVDPLRHATVHVLKRTPGRATQIVDLDPSTQPEEPTPPIGAGVGPLFTPDDSPEFPTTLDEPLRLHEETPELALPDPVDSMDNGPESTLPWEPPNAQYSPDHGIPTASTPPEEDKPKWQKVTDKSMDGETWASMSNYAASDDAITTVYGKKFRRGHESREPPKEGNPHYVTRSVSRAWMGTPGAHSTSETTSAASRRRNRA